jgi:hypothetical protein
MPYLGPEKARPLALRSSIKVAATAWACNCLGGPAYRCPRDPKSSAAVNSPTYWPDSLPPAACPVVATKELFEQWRSWATKLPQKGAPLRVLVMVTFPNL